MALMKDNIVLDGHATVASSPAVMGRASQLNTTVTGWQTVRMRLMREIAITQRVLS